MIFTAIKANLNKGDIPVHSFWTMNTCNKKQHSGSTLTPHCTHVVYQLPPGCPQEIQERTGIKWLHRLGFCPQSYKKGIYIDGHERSDVVEYRKMHLHKCEILASTHLPPPSCSDGLSATPIGNPEVSKH